MEFEASKHQKQNRICYHKHAISKDVIVITKSMDYTKQNQWLHDLNKKCITSCLRSIQLFLLSGIYILPFRVSTRCKPFLSKCQWSKSEYVKSLLRKSSISQKKLQLTFLPVKSIHGNSGEWLGKRKIK